MKYLNPRADLTFKRIFGEHPDLVMSLLNALLPLKEGEEITEIEYLSPEMVPENPMRKFTPQTFAEKRMQVLWLRFLTEISEATREIPEELLAEPEIKKALDILEESAFSDAELAGYDHFWDMVRTQKQMKSSFERKGKKEGLIEGEAIGIVKGRAEGLIEGVEQERYRTASLLKQSGVASKVIVRCTGLSVEEIEKL